MHLNELRDHAYYNAEIKGFHDPRKELGTSLMLIVAELAEVIEADRIGNEALLKQEIADVFILLGNFCGEYKIDIDEEVKKKMKINAGRPRKHGKKY